MVLWLCHLYLSLAQITLLAIGLTVLLLLVRIPMGKFYVQSLESMIRSDNINLDNFDDSRSQLPPQSRSVISEFLADSDVYTQIKGLELAANAGNPEQFLPEVKALLAVDHDDLRQGILKLFSNCQNQAILAKFSDFLSSADPIIKTASLEVLIANKYNFKAKQLEQLIAEEHSEVKILALIATFQNTQAEDLNSRITEQFWQAEITDHIALSLIHI